MSRVARTLPDPKNPQSLIEFLARLQRIVDGQIEFGSPQDPRDPASATLPDGVLHNGTQVNLDVSWFELVLDDATNLLNTEVTCTHNLGATVIAADQPNVRWLLAGWQHSNVGAGAGSSISVGYTGGTVTENSIQLRFYASARTVTVAEPLGISLIFMRAVHGMLP